MSGEFSIARSNSEVQLLSSCRLPHDRRGPLALARKSLREALEDISASPGQIVEGVYSCQIDGRFDVENVAFYNIGTGSFRNLSQNGLRARRCRLHSEALTPGFPHKLHYRLIPTPKTPTSYLVHLSFVPESTRDVFRVWWAAQSGQAVGSGMAEGPYGLHVELRGPNPVTNPAAKMKVLFDGVVAALQRDLSPSQTAVDRLSRDNGVDASLIEDRLRNPIANAIAAPGAQLVLPYRTRVQWRPADDKCEEATFLVGYGPNPICNAYLYALA